MGDALLQLAGDIFAPVVIEAVVILVCFNVLLYLIELLHDLTNLTTKGGD